MAHGYFSEILMKFMNFSKGKCESSIYHQGKEVDKKEVNMKICRQAEW